MLPFLKERHREQIWFGVADRDCAGARKSRHISPAERLRILPFLKVRQHEQIWAWVADRDCAGGREKRDISGHRRGSGCRRS
jgi:hypothetical protein